MPNTAVFLLLIENSGIEKKGSMAACCEAAPARHVNTIAAAAQ
jgi:hypothetical protein